MNKKPGDWNCRSCQYLNFSRRDMCQRCNDPRPPTAYVPGAGSGRSAVVLRGDWYCTCGYHNFASRSNCLKCTASKDPTDGRVGEADVPRGPRAFLPGDWSCTSPYAGLDATSTTSRAGRNVVGAAFLAYQVKKFKREVKQGFTDDQVCGYDPKIISKVMCDRVSVRPFEALYP